MRACVRTYVRTCLYAPKTVIINNQWRDIDWLNNRGYRFMVLWLLQSMSSIGARGPASRSYSFCTAICDRSQNESQR